MDERVKTLRSLEPRNAGRGSFLAILEAAAGLFGQFPARDITLRDILSIAGVSNQTLYNYFPAGRDDIAIALFDRFQRTMVDDFSSSVRAHSFKDLEDEQILAGVAAALARGAFGFLNQSHAIQANLHLYLRTHNLLCLATHTRELEESLSRVLTAQLGSRFAMREKAHLIKLSVRVARGVVDQAMVDMDVDLMVLESNTRLLVRTLLKTGLATQGGSSGFHDFAAYIPAPVAIVGAPISPAKKQSILDRILKRKPRP